MSRTTSATYGGTRCQPGVLGIDLGTTGTRIATAPFHYRGRFNKDAEPSLVLRPNHSKGAHRVDACDWPSTMNFWDTQKTPAECIGMIDDNPDLLPLTMYPHIVHIHRLRQRNTAADHKVVSGILDQIPQLRVSVNRFQALSPGDKDRALAHGMNICTEHLRQLKAAADRQAFYSGIELKKIGIAAPADWDSWTQNFFISIVQRVWSGIDEQSIKIVKESHAAAYWLTYLNPKMQQQRLSQIVLADFGGFTCSYDAFQINYANDGSGQISITDMGSTMCINAGSELHAGYVRRAILDDISRQARSQRLPAPAFQLYEGLMDDYHYRKQSKKHSICNGKPFRLTCMVDSAGGRGQALDFHVKFDAKQAEKLHEICFGQALTLLKRFVKVHKKSAVVFTGGSFYNTQVLEEADRIVKAAGLPVPAWVNSSNLANTRAGKIACGAALYLVNSKML